VSDEETCSEETIEQEFALVTAALPENLALALVVIGHEHGMHVLLDNHLPASALVDLINSVLLREQEITP
jgi:hypothetical protein